MARKERETVLSDDHQYTNRMYSYLTPPTTPRLETLSDGEDSDYFVKDSILHDDVDLYSTSCFDENDPFYDFAEDFRDLRMPMLKNDCMWGTAEQIRSTRTSPDSSCSSHTTSRNIAVTPLQLNFRSTTTTPINFDDRCGMNLFVPISSSILQNDVENGTKELVAPLKLSSNAKLVENIPLLSPNETESEDEIDVVSVPERPAPTTGDISTIVSETSRQKTGEKPKKKAVSRPSNLLSSSCNASPNSSDTDESTSSVRGRNIGATHGRVSHNDLERKRRDELKRKFDCLRAVIPELENNERAPKVVILKKAKAFVPRLQEEEKSLRQEKDNLKKMNNMLMRRLLLLAKYN